MTQTPVQPTAPARPQWVGITIKALITLAGASLAFRMVDAGGLVEALKAASLTGVAIATAVLTGLLVFNALRWEGVLQRLGAPTPRREVFQLTFVGFFFNQVLPGGIGGDVYRFAAAREHQAGLWRVLGSLLADRALSIIAAAVLLAVSCFLFPFQAARLDAILLFLLAGGFAFALTFVLIWGRWGVDVLTAILDALGQARLAAFARSAAARVGELNRDCATALRAPMFWPISPLAYAVLTQVGVTLVCWGLAATINHPVSLAGAFAAFPAIILLSMLPISLGGWGVRELAAIVLLAPLGLSTDQAVAVSVLFGIANLGAGLAAAALAIAHRALIGSPAAPSGEA